jgi:hypothetical protein
MKIDIELHENILHEYQELCTMEHECELKENCSCGSTWGPIFAVGRVRVVSVLRLPAP